MRLSRQNQHATMGHDGAERKGNGRSFRLRPTAADRGPTRDNNTFIHSSVDNRKRPRDRGEIVHLSFALPMRPMGSVGMRRGSLHETATAPQSAVGHAWQNHLYT